MLSGSLEHAERSAEWAFRSFKDTEGFRECVPGSAEIGEDMPRHVESSGWFPATAAARAETSVSDTERSTVYLATSVA